MREEAAAVCIQKNVRRWQAQKSYQKSRKSAIIIQSGARGMAARKEYRLRRQTKAGITIQVRYVPLLQYQLLGLTGGLKPDHEANIAYQYWLSIATADYFFNRSLTA